MPLSPKDLEERIAAARSTAPHDGPGPDADSYGAFGFGMRAGTQFVAAVVGGGALGWLIDRWLGTSPFGLLTLMILCFGAALVNVWLMMSRAVAEATARIDTGEMPTKDETRDTEEANGESS